MINFPLLSHYYNSVLLVPTENNFFKFRVQKELMILCGFIDERLIFLGRRFFYFFRFYLNLLWFSNFLEVMFLVFNIPFL